MDSSIKWDDLQKAPSLKNLTEGGFGALKASQHAAVQGLTKAHIESFDQAVTDGLSRVVQVGVTRSVQPRIALFIYVYAIYTSRV
ncbi:DNA-directed RNA polymerase I subunit RPA2 [Liparis tanakae]|uniref:DNA-directed RNA polymerase I subunit RPA2 n=1 Tax=Liparis tanakae TaxID=230148 RepID=A0A4Z2E395_9TELE|nr:DNA-directed RNA polymerase I subunit RPA2 [Liparis tanakae]